MQVSYTFSRDFISLLLKHCNAATDFGRTEVLLKGLRRVSQLLQHFPSIDRIDGHWRRPLSPERELELC